jgi:hypothetical protein
LCFIISNFAIWFRIPKAPEVTVTSGGQTTTVKGQSPGFAAWTIFIVVVLWLLSSLASLVTHIMARLKFKNGGDAKLTKISIICSMVANGCGTALYTFVVLIFYWIGFAIGSVNLGSGSFSDSARGFFLILGSCFIPVVLIFVSQLVAACPALKQCEDLNGGNGSVRTQGGNRYQQNANQSMNQGYNQGY